MGERVMPNYVMGIDLGTSAVKVLLVNRMGEVCAESSKDYPLYQPQAGYSEQNPEDWVQQTVLAIREVVATSNVNPDDIEGMSFSGQMHGLVLLDDRNQVIRNAILWNDTRTTDQCRRIGEVLEDKLLEITKNVALEGFTLPKILWVKENEPERFAHSVTFLLPKDYLRFRLTGSLAMDYSDAAGTLMLDVTKRVWSKEILDAFELPSWLCPPLVESTAYVGTITSETAEATGLRLSTKVFAGGADNACGALGAGILSTGNTLCSIGTSGVVLSYEAEKSRDFQGKVHFFNHAKPNAYYTMGVTLAAGYSLSWLRHTFARSESFEAFLDGVSQSPIGSNGLVFTPYLSGERTPYADATIRGSFIGIDGGHTRVDFVRAVLEGITFSLNDSIAIFRQEGKIINRVVSIGGGAKNDVWLQMQADIFQATIVKLENEQGPGMGAAMLAAVGCHWYATLEDCANRFVHVAATFHPIEAHVREYEKMYAIYTQVYGATKSVSEQLSRFRVSRSMR